MTETLGHVLIVDDLPDNRSLLGQLLRLAGYRTTEAENGAQALAMIEADRPDLVMLDLMMPVMDGFAVLERLKAQDEFLPVIVVTAVTEREGRLKALALGADEFLNKPFDPDELAHRVRWLLKLQQMTHALARQNEKIEKEVVARTAEARRKEREFRTLAEHSPDLISRVDTELRYVYLNPAAETAAGRPAAALIGKSLADLGLPAEAVEAYTSRLRKILETGQAEVFETVSPATPDRFYSSHVVPERNEAGEIETLLTISRDITERIRAEQQLTDHAQKLQAANEQLGAQTEELQAQTEELQAQHEALQDSNLQLRALAEQLKEVDALKDNFLSILSHELRTPLNAIAGFASVLDDEVVGPLTPQQHHYLGKILHGSDLLLSLINDLLDMSRIQAGSFSLLPGTVRAEELCHEVVESLHILAERKGQHISCETAPHLPTIAADRQRVFQVLINLVNNAIKFSHEGAQIRVRVAPAADGLRFEVEDNGPGIAQGDLPKLFKRFTQLETGNTRSANGTGLGLSISKALVEAHGGRIGVETTPGRGSIFWFELPAAPVGARPDTGLPA